MIDDPRGPSEPRAGDGLPPAPMSPAASGWWQAAVCMTVAGGGVAAMLIIEHRADEPTIAPAVLLGLLIAAFVVFFGFVVFAARRLELDVDDEGITFCGGIRRHRLRFDEVRAARWHPGNVDLCVGRRWVRVRTSTARTNGADEEECCRRIRDAIDPALQFGWDTRRPLRSMGTILVPVLMASVGAGLLLLGIVIDLGPRAPWAGLALLVLAPYVHHRMRAARERGRLEHGCCPNCAYRLLDENGGCPECGWRREGGRR